uniref:Secreted protein n=1 Tax=Arundo donax TaxID=35708 RepID=A0A0A8YGL5_ARUDO
MPTSRPSSFASLLAFTIASSVLTVTASSITEVSRDSGRNPGPIPWILCLPGSPPEMTGLSAGSTQMILTPGFCIFR